jgi:hypothetical protein
VRKTFDLSWYFVDTSAAVPTPTILTARVAPLALAKRTNHGLTSFILNSLQTALWTDHALSNTQGFLDSIHQVLHEGDSGSPYFRHLEQVGLALGFIFGHADKCISI